MNIEASTALLNARQARALDYLLREGVLMGTTLPREPNPPERVALLSWGEMLPAFEPIDAVTESSPDFDQGEHPAGRSLYVVAEDSRIWCITVLGICWPHQEPVAA